MVLEAISEQKSASQNAAKEESGSFVEEVAASSEEEHPIRGRFPRNTIQRETEKNRFPVVIENAFKIKYLVCH